MYTDQDQIAVLSVEKERKEKKKKEKRNEKIIQGKEGIER
jgi:hypothetical protein